MCSFVSISLIVLDKNILAILASHGGYVEYLIVVKKITILGTFLPSLFSNGMVVSERKMIG